MRLIDANAAVEPIEKLQRELCPLGLCGRRFVFGTDRELYDQLEDLIDAIVAIPAVDAEPVRHLSRESVYEPFYQWLGQPSSSNLWDELRSKIDDLVARCGAKMDEEDTDYDD